MTDAVIHIGFGKTGTSSLQAFMSSDGLDGTPYEYCAIDHSGEVLAGERLRHRTSLTPLGYTASTERPFAVDNEKVRAGLEVIRRRGKTPVLSQEYWSALGGDFKSRGTLELWGVTTPHIIAYVRPQAEYLNSGWWQWWRWNGAFASPADVLSSWGVHHMLWSKALSHWGNLTVRLHASDTISDFLSCIGAPAVRHTERKNTSMSREMIRLYEAIPGLRTEHGAPLDSVLSPHLNGGPTPWVISRDMVSQIVSRCRDDNEALKALLTPEQAMAMEGNDRWWAADAYPTETDPPLEPMDTQTALSVIRAFLPHYLCLLQQHRQSAC